MAYCEKLLRKTNDVRYVRIKQTDFVISSILMSDYKILYMCMSNVASFKSKSNIFREKTPILPRLNVNKSYYLISNVHIYFNCKEMIQFFVNQ